METINPQEWKQDLPAFKEKTDQFYAGELSKADYKGFSGGYGSYAQKDGKASMIRLRMSGGHLTKDKLKFIADSIKTYNVDKVLEINNIVTGRMQVSASIIRNNYFNYLETNLKELEAAKQNWEENE